jgi:hypothetical protein
MASGIKNCGTWTFSKKKESQLAPLMLEKKYFGLQGLYFN